VEEKKEVMNILIEDIIPNRFQPRLAFDDKELNDLATSIKQHGIIQPLVLRKISDKYEIIAGERRYKAAIIAGLSSVPAIIMNADDNTSAELAIVENVQRKNLNAMEEAQSYKKLADKGLTQEEIAKKIGVNQSTIANKIRLLALDEEVQDALLNNKISERHARSLLSLPDPASQIKVLNKIIVDKLTVKQAEDEIAKILGKNKPVIKEPVVQKNSDEIVDIDSKMNINDLLKPEPPKNYDYPVQTNDFNVFSETDQNNSMPINPFQEIPNIMSVPTPAPVSTNGSEILDFDDIEEVKLDNPVSSYVDTTPSSSLIEEFKQQKTPDVIVSEDNSLSISSAINSTRDLSKNLETKGFKVETEEFDFEDMYQVVFKIYKD
jgi:ParB family chromosome partitioning protein